ncbi:MAG: universal stress protein [Rhodospirillaceae bacterium]|jgi:nucleotide-binding universal stress UspA family protein
MFMKSIYLALSGEGQAESAADAAFTLAQVFKAHLIGSDTVSETGPFLDQTGVGMMATYYDELYQTAEKVQAHKRTAAANVFEAAREKHGIPLTATPTAEAATCYWHAHDGDVDVVARLGRLADVIVIACPGERSSYADLRTLEQAVFDAKRPVIMVPHGATIDPKSPVLVAWNGSAEAARALINAVPLMVKSSKVRVVQIGDLDPGMTALTEADAYLKLHGITATTKTIDKGKQSVSDILAREAGEIEAGCVVMGAYTHNPWREMVLGGVTKHMIKNASLPVLFAH